MLSNKLNKLNNEMELLVRSVVNECSMRHGFDAEEMIVYLLGSGGCKSKSKSKKELVSKSKEMVSECRFAIPYNGLLKENCCKAVCKNQGLYTQCERIQEKDSDFCTKCDKEMKKSESGKPIYGRMEDRLAVGIMEYRDPSGKSPTPFIKIMKKLKISREEVMEEASRLNIIIDEIHFREEEVGEKKEKGRPKKPKRKIELADDSTDLFAALVAKANEEEESSDDESGSIVESAESFESAESATMTESAESATMVESILDGVLDNVSIISENNEKEAAKEAEKQKKEAEKEAEKLAKEAEKLAKEAAKEAEKQKKEAEKEAAKLAKEAAKEAEKQKKEAEKQAKEAAKEAEKQAKETEKLAKEASKLSKKEPAKKVTKKTEDKPKEEDKAKEEQDVVKRFEFEGVKYLKSKNTGIIYNMDEDVVGKWNEKTNKIDFNEMDSEEEADEYEE
jgi:chemotaxis protein histidine kinase CheA